MPIRYNPFRDCVAWLNPVNFVNSVYLSEEGRQKMCRTQTLRTSQCGVTNPGMHRKLKLLALIGQTVAATALAAELPPAQGPSAKSMFDGKTLAGWEGDAKLWRVEDGLITGGSLTETVKQNEFL